MLSIDFNDVEKLGKCDARIWEKGEEVI